MALGQRRMLYTNLWQNNDFAKLSDKAKLLYVGLITVADDDGRFKASSLLLRSQVFPLDEKITQEDVRKWLNEVVRSTLIDVYRVNGDYFGQHPKWHKYQSIRKDLYKQSELPINPLRSRNEVSPKSHPNISKVKLSKEREEEIAKEYLLNLPEKDLNYFYGRFDCSKKAIVSKAEALFGYCKMHAKWYKDYRYFLLNAVKKDFEERKTPPITQKPEVQEEGLKTPIPQDIKDGIKKIISAKTIRND